MFARVSVYEIPADRRTDAETEFRLAVRQVRESPGLADAYVLFGSESERAMTITFWDSQAAMESSRVVASRLRSEAAGSVAGEVISVEEFEVMP